MTKNIIISYSEADENFLLTLFKKLKVKTKPLTEKGEKDYGDNGIPKHVADDIVEGLTWIKKRERGEVEGISWEQMMAELKLGEQEAATK